MSRKPLALLAGIAAFLIAAYGARLAFDWMRREPTVASDIMNRQWVEQTIGQSGVAFDAPWQLQQKELQLPPEVTRVIKTSRTFWHEGDGLNIMTMHIEFIPGTPLSLEGAADGAIANVKTVHGTVSVNGAKHEYSVLQQRAYQIEASVERDRGVPLRLRGIVFAEGPELYQIILICRDDQPLGSAVWDKVVKSIRRRAA